MDGTSMATWTLEDRAMIRGEQPRWYATLVHPVTIASFVLLLVNDHWLKPHHSGWLSGKLSDVAFMVVAPLWLFAAWSRLTSWHPRAVSPRSQRRALWTCMLVIGLTLALMETTTWGDWLYRYGLGALQFPFRGLAGWTLHAEWPAFTPVQATPDLTDLCCLPFLAVAHWIGQRSLLHGFTAR